MNVFHFKNFRNISLSIFFVFFHTIHPANIIFDMDGVLVKQSSFWACMNIGISKFLGIYNPFSLDQNLFNFLDLLEEHRPETPMALHHGRVLPQIMCDWLTGEKTNEEIRNIIEKGLEKHDNFFSTNSQKTLIAALCDFMFTPDKLIYAISPVKDTLKLAKKCSKTTDKFGNKNRIFILSNWDAESFSLLHKKKALRRLFNRCEGIVISGDVNLMKPDPAIFEYLLNKYNIDPTKELTVFVDDTAENVRTANNCNIHGILCSKLNINAVKKEFYELGIL